MEKFTHFVAHNWDLFLALAVTIGLIIYNEFFAGGRGVKRAGPHEATALISHDEGLVLDVREDSEYRDGHIIDSVHIPLSRLKERVGELNKHKARPIIVGCRSGHRSTRACKMLRQNGFETVYNLDGGILAWQNANLPLTRKSSRGK